MGQLSVAPSSSLALEKSARRRRKPSIIRRNVSLVQLDLNLSGFITFREQLCLLSETLIVAAQPLQRRAVEICIGINHVAPPGMEMNEARAKQTLESLMD